MVIVSQRSPDLGFHTINAFPTDLWDGWNEWGEYLERKVRIYEDIW